MARFMHVSSAIPLRALRIDIHIDDISITLGTRAPWPGKGSLDLFWVMFDSQVFLSFSFYLFFGLRKL